MIVQNHNKNIYPNGYSLGQKVKGHNNLNFSGPRFSHQSFETFEKFAKETGFINNILATFKPENFVDAGGKNNVYSIPGNDDFLIRVSKKILIPTKRLELKKLEDPFPDKNLGQKIASLSKNISVILKQSGKANGITDWHKVKFKKEHLPEFITSLKSVANMPQTAFNDMAEEIKFLQAKQHLFDHNPRNILIDEKKQAFNLVDIEPCPKRKLIRKIILNRSSNYMLFGLIDQRNLLTAYGLADKDQQNQIQIYAKEVYKKTRIATKPILKQNEFLFCMKLKCSSIKHRNNAYQKYKEFKTFLNSLE